MGQFIVDARTDAINRCKNIFSTVNKHHGKAPARSLKSKYKLQEFIMLYF